MKIVKITLLLLIPILLIVQGCGNSTAESQSMEQLHAEKGLPVRTRILETRPLSSSFSTYAVLTGIRESTANAAVADKVDQILSKVGDQVKKDDVVINFPTSNPAAKYNQAKVNVEHMKTTLDRMSNLFENGGISRQEYDNVAAQYKVAEANWDAVQQTVKVRAPISGTITRINVQESDNVHPGDALFTVAKTNEMKAQLWVTENRINDIERGAPAEASWNGQTLKGSVSQVDLSLNGAKQAFGVQVNFNNSNKIILSGINAHIKVFPKNVINTLVVARNNLIKEGDDYFAYKVIGDKAIKQAVTTGRQVDLDIEILGGLNVGEEIITEGLSLIEDGQKVRIIK